MFKEKNNIFQVNQNELIEFLKKRSIIIDKDSILIEGESIYFQFLNNTKDGESTFLTNQDIVSEFSEMELVEFVKKNDFRFEIYFDTLCPVEVV